MMDATIDSGTTFRSRAARGLNLFLAKRMKVPRASSIRISRALSIGLDPLGYLPRRRLAEKIAAEGAPRLAIAPGEAYRFLEPGSLPELKPAVAQARQV